MLEAVECPEVSSADVLRATHIEVDDLDEDACLRIQNVGYLAQRSFIKTCVSKGC